MVHTNRALVDDLHRFRDLSKLHRSLPAGSEYPKKARPLPSQEHVEGDDRRGVEARRVYPSQWEDTALPLYDCGQRIFRLIPKARSMNRLRCRENFVNSINIDARAQVSLC